MFRTLLFHHQGCLNCCCCIKRLFNNKSFVVNHKTIARICWLYLEILNYNIWNGKHEIT